VLTRSAINPPLNELYGLPWIAKVLKAADGPTHEMLVVTLLKVAGTQVVVHRAVLQHVVNGDQQAVGDRNVGTLLAATGGDAVVKGRIVVPGLRVTFMVASTRMPRSQRLPLPVLPEGRLPALSWLPGQILAQEAMWRWLGQRLMSSPISAKMSSAVRRPIP
jgi:hypothetical protein